MTQFFSIKNNRNNLIEYSFYVIIFILTAKLVALQLVSGPDYPTHLTIIDQYMSGEFHIPHPGFHIATYWMSEITTIPKVDIIPIFMAFTFVVTIILTKKVLLFLSPGLKYELIYVVAAIVANVAIAIYLPIYSESKYLGQWSPNIWHSPTMTLLKPFALLSFFGLILVLNERSNVHDVSAALISIYLLVSTYVKPSFVISFMPAVALYLVVFRFKEFKLYRKVVLIFAPCLLLLVYQFVSTYELKGTDSYFHDSIIFTWFGVMKVYTNNIFISTLLVMAFPLSIILVVGKRIESNNVLFFCWIFFIVCFLQGGLLAEKIKFNQGAFIFTYIIGLFILYVCSIGEYLSWFAENRKVAVGLKYKYISGFLLMYHFVSGVLYFNDVLMEKTF